MDINSRVMCFKEFKFEPIVNTHNQSTYAYEMLTVFPDNSDVEQFFCDADSVMLFNLLIAQINVLKKVRPLSEIFLNVSCYILCDTEKVLELSRFTPAGVSFELNDPEILHSLSETELNSLFMNVNTLKNNGLQVWLDDVTLDLFEMSKRLSSVIYGVKIDKVVFWDSVRHGKGSRLLTVFKDSFNMVVLEGVESEEHFNLAKKYNIPLCQGYKWSAMYCSA